MSDEKSRGVFRFGPFRANLDERLLFREGDLVALTPKAFDTLAALIGRREKVVDKAELLKLVWADSFVEENNLTQNISALRRIFGNSNYIETIPRRGYRFLPGPGDGFAESATLASVPGTAPSIDSLVVLPFVNMTGDPEDQYFSDGLTEELTNAVAQLEGLRVVARTTAFQFQAKALDIRSIAQQLQVSTVMEGSVRRQHNKLRITVQLIDARSGYHIWSHVYNRDLGDLFSVQEDISNQVADAIRPERSRLRPSAGIRDRKAYTFYLLGRFHRGKPDQSSVRKAMALFEQAIEREPGFAAAHSSLAECYMKLAQQHSMPPVEAWTAAQKSVDRALALDNNLAEAHTTQAIVHLLMDRDWDKAEREFRLAIALNENDAAAHHWFSHYFAVMGNSDESLYESRKALALDPLDVQISAHMIFHYVRARDFPNAIQAGLQTLELDPHSQLAQLFLMWAYEGAEQWPQAIAAAQLASRISADADALSAAVRTDGPAGYWRITKEFHAAQERPDNLRLAVCHANLREEEAALTRLEQAFVEREPELIYLKREPAFDWMKGHPRFRALTLAMALP